MYGGFKRRRSTKRSSFPSKRRKFGSSSKRPRLLPKDGGKRVFPNNAKFRPAAGGNGNTAVSVVYRQPTWMPDRLEIPLKTTASLIFTIASGVGAQASVIANSLADPTGTSGSYQPYGYDQLATIYAHYRVMACTIRTDWTLSQGGASTGLNNIFRIVVWPSLASTSFVSDPEGAKEAPYAKHALKEAGNSSTSMGALQVNNYMSTAKIFGERTETIRGSVNFGALMASDPTLPWYWNVLCVAQDPGAALSTAAGCQLSLVQYCELNRRIGLSST